MCKLNQQKKRLFTVSVLSYYYTLLNKMPQWLDIDEVLAD